MAIHTLDELKQRQALPLEIKLRMTQQRIREWVSEFGVEGVYISFSGGKDSTVLLHIVRELYPDIPAMFVDTGLEYPEIREFVKTFDNVDWVRPKMNFKQVINTYGYPVISKEVSQKVTETRSCPTSYAAKSFIPESEGGRPAQYNMSHYRFLLDAPFKISHKCCAVMKKNPAKKYEKETGRVKITGEMAIESRLRTTKWLQHGCNAFDNKRPVSKPMSFWLEQDVLKYIKTNNIKIASVYGDIVVDTSDPIRNQIKLWDMPGVDDNVPLMLTGCKRTGCMFCGYGCQLKDDQRFVQMKQTHPKQYDYIMRPCEQGGLNYKEVIDWINEHGNLNIKY